MSVGRLRDDERIVAALLGMMWLLLGLVKAADVGVFVAYIQELLGLADGTAKLGAWVAVVIETGLGLWLVIGAIRPRFASTVSRVASLVLAVVLVGATLTAGEDHQCGCLGGARTSTFGRKLLVSAALLYLSFAAIPAHASAAARRSPA